MNKVKCPLDAGLPFDMTGRPCGEGDDRWFKEHSRLPFSLGRPPQGLKTYRHVGVETREHSQRMVSVRGPSDPPQVTVTVQLISSL